MNRLITIAACLAAVAAIIYYAFSTKSGFEKSKRHAAHDSSAPPIGKNSPAHASVSPTPNDSSLAQEKSPRPKTMADLFERAQSGEPWPEPTREEIETFLDTRDRSPQALLTAYSVTQDSAYLDKALEADPDNPQLHLAAAMRDFLNNEADSPWIHRLLESDPDNPLPSWLAANSLLEHGDLEGALAELHSATNKSKFNDYFIHRAQDAEEFFVQRGDPPAIAKAQGLFDAHMPHIQSLGNLRKQLDNQIDQLLAAGQTDQAQELALLGIEMGNRLSQGDGNKTLLAELVGLTYEKQFLEAFDPDQSYPQFSQPIPEMLEDIERQSKEIQALAKEAPDILMTLPVSEAAAYFDRMKLFGEKEAHRWLIERNQSQ
ncbi:MAG: hypothetical protein AAGD22_16415 [Verrucomicrobiota bacterium]